MRHRRRKAAQRDLPLAPPPRLPSAVKEMTVLSLAELIARVMQRRGPGKEASSATARPMWSEPLRPAIVGIPGPEHCRAASVRVACEGAWFPRHHGHR